MTAPLTPANCDLRDFHFMPLDIVRLFSSDFHALSTDAEWRAGVTLWLRSYHQVPAASLPDDDIALARLAELGRNSREWRKVRAGALRGWVKCDDGRLYHRTVAEKALEGWIEKLSQRKSSAAGNAKRYGHVFDPASLEREIEDSLALLAALNPQSRALSKRGGRQAVPAPIGTPDAPPDDLPPGDHRDSRRPPDAPPDDLLSGSQGTGTSKGLLPSLRSGNARAPDCSKSTYPPDAFERWWAGYPEKVGKGAAEKSFERIRKSGLVSFEKLVRGVEAYRKAKPPDRAWCNPATWLNQQRWLDGPNSAPQGADPAPHVDFGGGVVWPESTVRDLVARYRRDPSIWPADRLGPPPEAPGCKVPARLLEAA